MFRSLLVMVGVAMLAYSVTSLVRRDRYLGLDFERVTGPEIALVLVVSPTCAACQEPVLLDLWTAIKSEFRESAVERGEAFRTSAVAISRTPEGGQKFLRRFGPFHEVSAGRGWENAGIRRYVLQDIPGPAKVPQVIVLSRELSVGPSGIPTVTSEEVVWRIVGLENLINRFGSPD